MYTFLFDIRNGQEFSEEDFSSVQGKDIARSLKLLESLFEELNSNCNIFKVKTKTVSSDNKNATIN